MANNTQDIDPILGIPADQAAKIREDIANIVWEEDIETENAKYKAAIRRSPKRWA